MTQIEGKTFLVTGGAGNLGSHVVDALIAAGAARIVIVDNFYNGHRDNLAAAMTSETCEIELVNLDIAERDRLLAVFQQFRPDGVFHMASSGER